MNAAEVIIDREGAFIHKYLFIYLFWGVVALGN